MKFIKTQFQDRPSDEKNDCVVRALSLTAGVSYFDAHKVCGESGRKFAKRTMDKAMDEAASRLGLKKVVLAKKTTISKYLETLNTDEPMAIAIRGHLTPVKHKAICDISMIAKPGQVIRWVYVK